MFDIKTKNSSHTFKQATSQKKRYFYTFAQDTSNPDI